MSLRSRLVLSVLGMLTLGLFLSAGATFGALQDWRGDRTDDVMAVIAAEAGRRPVTSDGDFLKQLVPTSDTGPVWRTLTERGHIPSFYQLRARDGRIIDTVAFGPRPRLPDPLPQHLWPSTASPENPTGSQFGQVGTERAGGGSAQPNWRIMTARLAGRDRILVLGASTAASDEFTSRTRNVAVITSLAVSLALAGVAHRTIRLQLRPLEKIATTAAAIGAGDLTSRVAGTDPRTEVGRLGGALNAMLVQIEDAFRARERSEDRLRRFVADASHELRTPIATIRGYAELFHRGASTRPDDLANAMHRIESEASRMGHLVDELLLLARLDQGRPLERQPVDLNQLAIDSVHAARAVEPDRPIVLEHNAQVLVCGDAARLRQVLDNLLANVRQHTPPGAPVTVRVAAEAGHVVLDVADRGPGMDDVLRDRVFERFFRGGTTRSPDDGGSGLGLSIVRAVVQAHGGTVQALPGPEGGTLLHVVIPHEEEAAVPGPAIGGGEQPS